jgi:diadenosine tetraphosphatase ApaH/serine/threonine PP2A family protein phosphatase
MAERVAFISDIHANLEALEAVLADIGERGVGEILCLGDVVGYGIDPEACIDRVQRRAEVCLCGNHDWAAVNSALGFNATARRAIEYTQARLKPGRLSGGAARRRWEFLEKLPHEHRIDDWLLVHGSPRDPVMEYIFPEDVDMAPEKIEEIFGLVERVCFVGHTHLPGVFTEDLLFRTPAALGGSYYIGQETAVVNVGSVGQPRDGDPRACYAIVGDDTVTWRRVEYDVQKTMEKIRSSPLDNLAAERLALGK